MTGGEYDDFVGDLQEALEGATVLHVWANRGTENLFDLVVQQGDRVKTITIGGNDIGVWFTTHLHARTRKQTR